MSRKKTFDEYFNNPDRATFQAIPRFAGFFPDWAPSGPAGEPQSDTDPFGFTPYEEVEVENASAAGTEPVAARLVF